MAKLMERVMGGAAGKLNPAYTHGHTAGKFSPEYHTWSSMLQRCSNPKRNSWKHYGGKGVKVCARWRSFENFLADMGLRPAGMSLDRIDVQGDYTPENCRWADVTTQARNSVQVVWVEIAGERKRLVEWCEQLGMSINTVRCRVKTHGWSYPEALLTPKQDMTKRGARGRLTKLERRER